MLQPFEGKYPQLGEPSFAHEAAVLIGNVRLEDHVSVWPGAVLRGDLGRITVGSYANVQDNAVVHAGDDRELRIGQRVTIGHGAILYACTVEDEAVIGMGSIILEGAVIGKGAVIAAGALVSQGTRVEPGMLYVGSPARVWRPITPEEAAYHRNEVEAYWRKAQLLALSLTNDL